MGSERRRYQRHSVRMLVVLSTDTLHMEAVMVDIGEGGIGIVSPEAISPGTAVLVRMKYFDEYALKGWIKWSCQEDDDGVSYHMGLEVDCIIWNEMRAISFPERGELVAAVSAESGRAQTAGESRG